MHENRSDGRLHWVLSVLLIGTACWLFQTNAHQAAPWRGAYFSMAANWQPSGRFLIDTAEVNRFDALPAPKQATYRFRRSPPERPTEYVFMQTGYGHICAIACRLWPFGGDSQAVIVWQSIVHIGLCLWLLSLLPAGWRQYVLLVGYACNPFIIRYVTYDFYYFWQVIPSVLFVGTWLGWWGTWRAGLWVGPLLGLLFATRPAMMGALIGLGMYWAWQRQFGLLAVTTALVLLVGTYTYRPPQSALWRPMYVGIAAYPNQHMNTLSDVAIYNLYKARTDQPYRHGGSDPVQEIRLTTILTQEVSMIWQKAPLLFVKNALINTLLAFSAGYMTGGGWLNYALALLGLLVLTWLIRRRRYVFVFAVLATVGTFTPYYPPIPAYMYGAYLLLFMAFVAPAGKTPAASRLR